ncbi:MAG: 50S ribosomal protein L29 [Candidatus Aenigmarchaeota archaeon]|nr:50S ribosomal protein L29 [Candidatus Aenigmarchaeota archaeon]
MKPEERMKRLGEFRLELSKLKGSSAVGASIKEPGKVKELRKAVARILTINKEETSVPNMTKKKIKKFEGGKEG